MRFQPTDDATTPPASAFLRNIYLCVLKGKKKKEMDAT